VLEAGPRCQGRSGPIGFCHGLGYARTFAYRCPFTPCSAMVAGVRAWLEACVTAGMPHDQQAERLLPLASPPI